MDREKVIRGLEICSDCGFCESVKKFDLRCPYRNNDGKGCDRSQLLMDALALLKEQEEKNGEWITIWREDDPDTSTQARCSICNRISERPLGGYCKWCGAKMSQEWGVDG